MSDEEKKEEAKTKDQGTAPEQETDSRAGDSAFTPDIGAYVFFAVLAILLIALVVASFTVKPETPNLAKDEPAQEEQKNE